MRMESILSRIDDVRKIRRWLAVFCSSIFFLILFLYHMEVHADPVAVTITAPSITGWTYGEAANAPQSGTVNPGTYSGEVNYRYYINNSGTKGAEITGVPQNAGAYYVQEYINATSDHQAAESPLTAFTISRKDITGITGITVRNGGKVYDRSKRAELDLSNASLLNVNPGDNVTLASAEGNFVDANVGNAKQVNVSNIVLGGTDAGNYVLNFANASSVPVTGNITQRPITGCTVSTNPSTATLTGSGISIQLTVHDSGLNTDLRTNEFTVGAVKKGSTPLTSGYSFSGGFLTISSPEEADYTIIVNSSDTNGTGNYSSAGSVTGKVTIKGVPGKATIKVRSVKYNQTPSPVVNTTTNTGASYTISYKNNSTGATSTSVPTAPGVYTATVRYDPTGIYSAATASTTFSIADKVDTTTAVPGRTTTPYSTSKSTFEQNIAAQNAYKNTKSTAPANDYSKTSRSMFGDFQDYYEQEMAKEAAANSKNGSSASGSSSGSSGSGSGSASGSGSGSGSSSGSGNGTGSGSGTDSGSGSGTGSGSGSSDGSSTGSVDGSTGGAWGDIDEEYSFEDGVITADASDNGTVTVNSGIYDSRQYSGQGPSLESNRVMIFAGGWLILTAEVFLIVGINGLTHGAVVKGFRSFTRNLSSKVGKRKKR